MSDFTPIASGAAFVLVAVLIRGRIAPGSGFGQSIRAQYVLGSPFTRALPFSYRRLVAAALPFAFSIFLIGCLSLLPREERAPGYVLIAAAGICWLVAGVAFVWPRRFLPRWMRDADDGRLVDIDPGWLNRTTAMNAPLPARVFWLLNAAAVAGVALGLALDAPGSIMSAVLISWSVLVAWQYAT